MYFETDAIVIKATKTLTNDVFLTLLSRKAGKIEVVANGAKSSKSQLSAVAKPFVFGQFILNTQSKVMKIVSCEIHDSHFRVTDHIETLAYGNYFLELCNLVTAPNVVDLDHYQVFIEVIDQLSHKSETAPQNLALLQIAYLIKLSVLTGHSPNLGDVCSSCNSSHSMTYFSVEQGGVLCKKCSELDRRAFKINEQMIQLIQYLMKKDIRIIMKTKIHDNYIQLLYAIFEAYILYHNGLKEIKSKDFILNIM